LVLLQSQPAIDECLEKTVVEWLYSWRLKVGMDSKMMVDDEATTASSCAFQVFRAKFKNAKMSNLRE
jgi:hypothetical protein